MNALQNISGTLDLINHSTFERDDVVKYYYHAETLLDAERAILERLRPKLSGGSILDIGVGGGRTTPHLLDISRDYTAIDYVEAMALSTAEKFPHAKVLQMDATDMRQFKDASFDFVCFSYNGLDCLSHEARAKALGEIFRVLKPGGIFMFSSHNRDYRNFDKMPWRWDVKWDLKFAIFVLHCIFHLPKHFRMRKHAVYTDDYAIVNDGDHRFSLMLYYISIAMQQKQLSEIGFDRACAYDQIGNLVETDTGSHWMHYVATKS